MKDSHYFPGVIRNASHGEIYVEFDGEGKLVKYTDVLGAGKYDVIGDASPSVSQVTVDANVCVRCPTNSNNHVDSLTSVFVKGIVYEIQVNPVQFVVKIPTEGDQHNKFIFKRADLRLVQPPWWDELEGLESADPPRAQVVGKFSKIRMNLN